MEGSRWEEEKPKAVLDNTPPIEDQQPPKGPENNCHFSNTVFRLSQSHPQESATEVAVGAGLHATGATTAKPCWEPIISSTRITRLDGAATGREMYAESASHDKQ